MSEPLSLGLVVPPDEFPACSTVAVFSGPVTTREAVMERCPGCQMPINPCMLGGANMRGLLGRQAVVFSDGNVHLPEFGMFLVRSFAPGLGPNTNVAAGFNFAVALLTRCTTHECGATVHTIGPQDNDARLFAIFAEVFFSCALSPYERVPDAPVLTEICAAPEPIAADPASLLGQYLDAHRARVERLQSGDVAAARGRALAERLKIVAGANMRGETLAPDMLVVPAADPPAPPALPAPPAPKRIEVLPFYAGHPVALPSNLPRRRVLFRGRCLDGPLPSCPHCHAPCDPYASFLYQEIEIDNYGGILLEPPPPEALPPGTTLARIYLARSQFTRNTWCIEQLREPNFLRKAVDEASQRASSLATHACGGQVKIVGPPHPAGHIIFADRFFRQLLAAIEFKPSVTTEVTVDPFAPTTLSPDFVLGVALTKEREWLALVNDGGARAARNVQCRAALENAIKIYRERHPETRPI